MDHFWAAWVAPLPWPPGDAKRGPMRTYSTELQEIISWSTWMISPVPQVRLKKGRHVLNMMLYNSKNPSEHSFHRNEPHPNYSLIHPPNFFPPCQVNDYPFSESKGWKHPPMPTLPENKKGLIMGFFRDNDVLHKPPSILLMATRNPANHHLEMVRANPS